MPTTAGQVAEQALKLILVQAADAPLEADEYADLFVAMNNYMAAMEGDGIRLGYTPVDSTNDILTVPPECIRGIVANVAIEVAPQFQGVIGPSIQRQAEDGWNTMYRIGAPAIRSRIPSTLPRGSGQYWGAHQAEIFIDDEPVAQLALAGNAMAAGIQLPATAVPVAGQWQVVQSAGLVGDINGRVTNRTIRTLAPTLTVVLSVTGAGNATFRVRRGNANLFSFEAAALSATPTEVMFRRAVPMDPRQFVELWVETDTGDDVTVTQARLELL